MARAAKETEAATNDPFADNGNDNNPFTDTDTDAGDAATEDTMTDTDTDTDTDKAPAPAAKNGGPTYAYVGALDIWVADWNGERRTFDTEDEMRAWFRAERGTNQLKPFALWLTDEKLIDMLSRPAVEEHVIKRGPHRGKTAAAREAYVPDERAIKIARTRILDGASLYLEFAASVDSE